MNLNWNSNQLFFRDQSSQDTKSGEKTDKTFVSTRADAPKQDCEEAGDATQAHTENDGPVSEPGAQDAEVKGAATTEAAASAAPEDSKVPTAETTSEHKAPSPDPGDIAKASAEKTEDAPKDTAKENETSDATKEKETSRASPGETAKEKEEKETSRASPGETAKENQKETSQTKAKENAAKDAQNKSTPQTPQSHYEVLGIEPDADDAMIKRAWKTLSLKLHPDKTQGTTKSEFQNLQSAYEVLSDPAKKKQYDLTLKKQKQRVVAYPAEEDSDSSFNTLGRMNGFSERVAKIEKREKKKQAEKKAKAEEKKAQKAAEKSQAKAAKAAAKKKEAIAASPKPKPTAKGKSNAKTKATPKRSSQSSKRKTCEPEAEKGATGEEDKEKKRAKSPPVSQSIDSIYFDFSKSMLILCNFVSFVPSRWLVVT